VAYVYLNQENLEDKDWEKEDFENQHKNSFASSHKETKEK
jgi:hypothetical protein